MIDSVADLVEEHFDSGGSRFSESSLERWRHAIVSQRNVIVLEFGSPCLLRLPSVMHDSSSSAMDFPFFYEVLHLQRLTYRFHEKNVLVSCLSHQPYQE